MSKATAPATLVDKEIVFHSKFFSEYFLVFEFFNGKKISFSVLPDTHSRFFIGDKGILTYKGKRFIYFNKKY